MDEPITPCECTAFGDCPRHKLTKHPHWHKLCQTRQDYYDAWEQGRGPGQTGLTDAPQPDAFPCRHRGELLEVRTCDLCGSKGQPLEIYHCTQVGECSIGRRHSQVTACIACELREESPPRRVLLRDPLCPGDITVLTAAVRDLHAQYPGRYVTAVDTPHPALWEHNPHVVPAEPDFEPLDIHYDADKHFPGRGVEASINVSSSRPIHMLEAYCEGLSHALGLERVLRPRHWLEPSIRLSAAEKGWRSQVQEVTGRPVVYWLINAGTKSDYTAKQWPYYQELVDRTRDRITWVQVGSASDQHPPLAGVVDLVGKTSLRQLVRLVYHAAGVVCGVTALAHLAHWVERGPFTFGRRPAVILAGGRESPHWFAYPGQQIMHTIGELDCCAHGGCWKSRVAPLREGSPSLNASLCEHPVDNAPLCMRRLLPEHVAHVVRRLAL
jgi:ADP-heptose:LPS heptosyltransferase